MNQPISFTLIIEPRSQLRHRTGQVRLKGGQVITKAYDCERTKLDNETLSALLLPHKPPVPLTGPLELTIDAYLKIPKGFSKKKTAAALSGELRPITKPDLDNLAKKLKDRMGRGFFYEDDKQIVTETVRKWYGDPPRWEVMLEQARQLALTASWEASPNMPGGGPEHARKNEGRRQCSSNKDAHSKTLMREFWPFCRNTAGRRPEKWPGPWGARRTLNWPQSAPGWRAGAPGPKC
jgi:Holliday junction resolvase RusA-like endonuclease